MDMGTCMIYINLFVRTDLFEIRLVAPGFDCWYRMDLSIADKDNLFCNNEELSIVVKSGYTVNG